MRFLHTADWQIGRQYPRFPADDAAALAEARFTAVSRLADLGTEGAYQAILVAGDVFDAQTVSERSIRRLFNVMQGYSGPWVLIPGNHDAALAESVWTRARRLGVIPDNVHLATRPQVMEFPDLGFAILPAPLTQRQTASDLTAWFDQAQTTPGLLRIGLAHGSVQGILAQDIDSPNPIAPDRAQRARLDYLALGDWHGTRQINDATWYSGTPEPDRFKSNGSGQALSVEIAAVGVQPLIEVLSLGSFTWLSWQEHLTVDSDLDMLLKKLMVLPDSTVLELAITGHTDLAGQQRLQAGLAQAEAKLRSLLYDVTGLQFLPTDADITALRADGYLGDVLVLLQEYDQGQQVDGARDALVILADILREVQQGGDAT